MTVVKREVPMKMPSLTLCDNQGGKTKDMLLWCYFGTITCLEDNVTVYFDVTVYKKVLTCIRLNFGSNSTILQKTESEGKIYGYSIMFYIPNEADVLLGVTDNNDLAVQSDINKKIIPGENNEIILSKSKQQKLPDPFSNCEENNSSLLVKGTEVNYRQVNCADVCFNRVMTQICKCEYPGGCLPTSKWSTDCWNTRYNRTLINADCLNKCPLECNQIAFPVTRLNYKLDIIWVDRLKYFISNKFDIRNHTNEQIRSKIAYVFIYYDKLDTTEITQTPKMTMLDLISQIGGILGNLKNCYF